MTQTWASAENEHIFTQADLAKEERQSEDAAAAESAAFVGCHSYS